ncbi:oligopeptide:H+ symporter, partial [Piscirickettsia litoralis]|uniref:oligopeptide:H+ symporter n=1 Tax=Piscirickettsia litoralis TaxID=1891921 RepID=UPI0013904BAA
MPKITSTVLIVASIMIIFWVIIVAMRESYTDRNKIIAALILTVISVGFWALYNQTFTSLMLFAERNMQPDFLGMKINAEFTQFFNPFFIIVLSPILSQLWLKLDRYNLNPSTPNKFFLSTLFMLFGFMVLAFATRYMGHDGMTSAWWLVASYFLQTVGELLISPIGLAMITVLVPRHLVGMMMGVWFLSQAAAFSLSGFLATVSAVPDHLPIEQSLTVYAHAF